MTKPQLALSDNLSFLVTFRQGESTTFKLWEEARGEPFLLLMLISSPTAANDEDLLPAMDVLHHPGSRTRRWEVQVPTGAECGPCYNSGKPLESRFSPHCIFVALRCRAYFQDATLKPFLIHHVCILYLQVAIVAQVRASLQPLEFTALQMTL